jgi:hypothetical protein
MDGQTLTRELADIIREDPTTSGFMRKLASYDWLYQAAVEVTRRTQCLTSTQTITTVASQRTYDLNADFLWLYLKSNTNEYFLKYNNGTNDTFITWRDLDPMIIGNQTTAVSIPNNFCIVDKSTTPAQITGTATGTGTLNNSESTLTDSLAPFATVSVGDEVHNVTSVSDGIVLSVTSTSALITAIFTATDGVDAWAISDNYVIVPQGRKQVYLDPPPLTSGHTITVNYVQKPTPVYSPYRSYRFDNLNKGVLVKYAAWLYKYRDREPSYGDAFYKYFEVECSRMVKQSGRERNKYSFKVNFMKRSGSDRSSR